MRGGKGGDVGSVAQLVVQRNWLLFVEKQAFEG